MGIDCLALMIAQSPYKNKTEASVMKELGVQGDGSKSLSSQQFGSSTTKDNQIFAQI